MIYRIILEEGGETARHSVKTNLAKRDLAKLPQLHVGKIDLAER